MKMRIAIHLLSAVLWAVIAAGILFHPELKFKDDRVIQAVDRAMPSIVDIEAESSTVIKGKPAVKIESDRVFFIRPLRGLKASRHGAGIVVDSKGLILTNAHVVEGLDQVNVLFSGKKRFNAVILAVEKTYDLAVLKIQTDEALKPISFSDSDRLKPGESVIAVGNPFGLGKSVSLGIVSAIHRDIVWKERNLIYSDLVQTDISLNSGSSGGPLLNLRGELAGLNLAVPVGSQGISFAISSNTLRKVYQKYQSKV